MKNRVSILCCLLFTLGSAQWLERQVVIGDTLGGISFVAAGGIVVNPMSGNVYIESDPIQIFNPVTREKLRGPGSSGLVAFCSGSGKGYVLGNTAAIIDAAADTAIGSTVLPFPPYYHAYSHTSNRLYLGEQNEESLLVFDPDGDSILRSVGVGSRVASLLWDSVWNRVYVGTRQDSTMLKVLDCSADTFVGSVQLGSSSIRSLVLSYASRKLYCYGSEVYVVSTDSLKSIGTVDGMNIPSPDRFAYSPVTDRIYWSSGAFTDTVSVIDCQGDTIRAQLATSLPVLTASTLNGHVYVGLVGSAQVLVVDTSDSVVDTVAIPTAPTTGVYALAFGRDRNEVYGVTSGDLAFIIDVSADTIAGAVSYAAYLPRQMVHNPAGNKLYVLCPGHDEVLVLDSTFGPPKHVLGGATDGDAQPVLNPALNRLYVADYHALRVIDCNSDSLLGSRALAGFSRPRPVMVPYLNKLYVFDNSGGRDSVYAYDCLRDTVVPLFELRDDVPCAVYDPRSNRVFFACRDAPTVRALDPEADSVVKTFDLVGGSYHGKMALNLDLGRLYYVDQSPDILFTIDVLTDSTISSESMPGNVDTMFLNRRLGKLYLCLRSQTLVLDCGQNIVVDTVDVGFRYAGLMDDRNDKLYLRYGAVVDCRYDSVIGMLPPDSLSPRSMAWGAIDNRVFQATTSWLYVYRDDPYGMEDGPVGFPEQRHATVIRGVLVLGAAGIRQQTACRAELMDISGRKVMNLHAGANDVRALAPGVYFVRGEGRGAGDVGRIRKVVVTR